MIAQTPLSELLELYLDCRDVSSQYAQGVRGKLLRYIAWAGDDSPAALTEKNLNAFLRTLDRSRSTVANYRGDLLVVWRWVADQGFIPPPRERLILAPRTPQIVPECWTTSEVKRLIEASLRASERLANGVRWRDYWEAAVRVGYETGLRRGDVCQLEMKHIFAGVYVRVSGKTGVRTFHQLSKLTIAALKRIGGPTPLAWPYDHRHFGRRFEKIVADAGVRRGTFKWLRRTSGSYVEALHPGEGPKHLGHTNPSTFRKFYDARILADVSPRPTPPPLDNT